MLTEQAWKLHIKKTIFRSSPPLLAITMLAMVGGYEKTVLNLLVLWHVYITYFAAATLIFVTAYAYNRGMLIMFVLFITVFWGATPPAGSTHAIVWDWTTTLYNTDVSQILGGAELIALAWWVDFVKFLTFWTNPERRRWTEKTPSSLLGSTRPAAQLSSPLLYDYNRRVFHYLQLYNQLNRTAYTSSSSYAYYRKLIKLNTKRGLYQQNRTTLAKGLARAAGFFSTFRPELADEYPNYLLFFEFSKNFPNEFYKPDFFLRYIYSYLELIFLIKKIHPKKKSKKIKQIPKLRILYVPRRRRVVVTLRLINSYLNNFNLRTKLLRVGNAILYLLLAGKQSFLYKKKLAVCTKLLEKKKFY